MANEDNQTLKVQPGGGATTGAGLDAGTDKEQVNREANDDAKEENRKTKTDSGAGGTSIKADTAETYGAGEPENLAGGTTSGGATGTTGRGTGEDTTGLSGDTDISSRGAPRTGEVTKEDSSR